MKDLSRAELASLLALYGISKKDIAETLHVSPSYVSKITRETIIQQRHADRIRNALRQVLLKRELTAYPEVTNYTELPDVPEAKNHVKPSEVPETPETL